MSPFITCKLNSASFIHCLRQRQPSMSVCIFSFEPLLCVNSSFFCEHLKTAFLIKAPLFFGFKKVINVMVHFSKDISIKKYPISENTGKFLLCDLAALTNRIYCTSQHGTLVNRFPVMMMLIGWREFPIFSDLHLVKKG